MNAAANATHRANTGYSKPVECVALGPGWAMVWKHRGSKFKAGKHIDHYCRHWRFERARS